MFSDTLTITINSVAKVLTRINTGENYASEYLLRGTADEFRLRIRHSSYLDKARGAKMDRHNVELTQTVYPVAPSTTSTVRKAYVVLENQATDAVTDSLNFDLGFAGFLTSANVTKLLNYES